MQISMARGDIYSFSFAIFIDDEPTSIEMDEIYFTVKKHHYDTPYVIQKRLSNGGIVGDGQGSYSITIEPEDTDDLTIGTYDFDIQVEKLPDIKRTFIGKLELTPEVTHRGNEVPVNG